jgi:hypothetical protein
MQTKPNRNRKRSAFRNSLRDAKLVSVFLVSVTLSAVMAWAAAYSIATLFFTLQY